MDADGEREASGFRLPLLLDGLTAPVGGVKMPSDRRLNDPDLGGVVMGDGVLFDPEGDRLKRTPLSAATAADGSGGCLLPPPRCLPAAPTPCAS